MAERALSVEQVAISTATVQIKTLTLGRKQMTLSVFRQLPRLHPIDPATCELRGQPWGWVNYFWGDCRPVECNEAAGHIVYGRHLHVVWQRGQELYRGCVHPDPQRDPDVQDFAYDFPAAHLERPGPGRLRRTANPEWGPVEERLRVLWPTLYAQLEALGQLFIAV
jgi:hypothetical protein